MTNHDPDRRAAESEKVHRFVELKIYEGDDLVLHQRGPAWPFKIKGGQIVYQGWEVTSGRMGYVFETQGEALAKRQALAVSRAPVHPGGFVGALAALTVAPVEWR